MSKNKWLVPGLIVFGTLLILISIWGPKSQFGLSSADNEMPASVLLKKEVALHARDIIRTGEASDISIQWTNQGQFRVIEKSEILIDQLENGQPLVVVRSGDIYVEKFGAKPSFWIRKDGQLLSVVDFALADRQNAGKLKEPIPEQKTDNQITQFEIEALLNSKKTDFFKCYGQILQKNAPAQGSVLLSFTIQNQGQTTKIEVSKSDINDNTFKTCLMEVVARTQFKSFSGPPVTTVFPLKFE
jgi:TonB family protein